jgi:hypothetical protein
VIFPEAVQNNQYDVHLSYPRLDKQAQTMAGTRLACQPAARLRQATCQHFS